MLAGRMLSALGLNVVPEAGIALSLERTALPWRPRIVLTSVDAEAAGPDDVSLLTAEQSAS